MLSAIERSAPHRDVTDKECTSRRSLPLALSCRLQQHEWKDWKVQGQLRHRIPAQKHELVVENWRRCGNEILQCRGACRCRNSPKQGRHNVIPQMPLPQQLALGTPQRRTVAKPNFDFAVSRTAKSQNIDAPVTMYKSSTIHHDVHDLTLQ